MAKTKKVDALGFPIPADEDEAKQMLLALTATMPGGATLPVKVFEGEGYETQPWERVTFASVAFASVAVYLRALKQQLNEHYQERVELEREVKFYRSVQRGVQEFLGLEVSGE